MSSEVHNSGEHHRPKWVDELLRFWPVIVPFLFGIIAWAQAYADIQNHGKRLDGFDQIELDRRTQLGAMNATMAAQTKQLERMDAKLDRLIEQTE